MTALDVDALDELRDELAELAWGVLVAAGMRDDTRAPSPSVIAHAIVGNLLPVMDRIANERAAAALEAFRARLVNGPPSVVAWVRELDDHIAALRASNGDPS